MLQFLKTIFADGSLQNGGTMNGFILVQYAYYLAIFLDILFTSMILDCSGYFHSTDCSHYRKIGRVVPISLESEFKEKINFIFQLVLLQNKVRNLAYYIEYLTLLICRNLR